MGLGFRDLGFRDCIGVRVELFIVISIAGTAFGGPENRSRSEENRAKNRSVVP